MKAKATKTKKVATNNVKVMGPLQKLYDDSEITEICVDAPDRIYYWKKNKLLDAAVKFDSVAHLNKFIANLSESVGRKMDYKRATFRLSDGTHVSVVTHEIALHSPCVVISKLIAPLRWEELTRFGVVDDNGLKIIEKILEEKSSIIVAGGLGSGKTMMARVFGNHIDPALRVVSVERHAELILERSRYVGLETSPGISVRDLIDTAMSLRPDWLIINEILGPEAETAIKVMRFGAPTIGVVHADNVVDVLTRLEHLYLSANLGSNIEDIRNWIAGAVKYITCQQKCVDGKRRIIEIAKINGYSEDHYDIQPLYKYDEEQQKFIVLK